jgi:hypothetical protein
MISHAWTVVCSKTLIDIDSNNISLDVSEQIKIQGLSESKNQTIAIPGFTLTVASLWYRGNPDTPERGAGRIKYIDPNGFELGTFALDLNLEKVSRLRTRATLPRVPIRGSGWYFFVIEQKVDEMWVEMAKIPHEIIVGHF